MAEHVHLKNEFTEDEKCHNLMSWLSWSGKCNFAANYMKIGCFENGFHREVYLHMELVFLHLFCCEYGVFILINPPGHCNSKVLKLTFLRQNMGTNTKILMSWRHFYGIWPPLSHKKWEGMFIRDGAVIRINMVAFVCDTNKQIY